MENKINIAELLKDCPRGMELDCTTWENVTFEEVRNDTIIIVRNNKQPYVDTVALNKYGRVTSYEDEKCRIFPKGKTTWEGFHRPFKDGDILATNDGSFIAIIKKNGGKYYCCCYIDGSYFTTDYSGWFDRFATEEEKQKLFQVIKNNGYRWNPETKKLEKLIKPIFKKGDKIRVKKGFPEPRIARIIEDVCDTFYTLVSVGKIDFTDQNNWELVPDKFDISKLKPFDEVLFRMHDKDTWCNGFYGFYKNNRHVVNSVIITKQCIPYKGNEYLLNTTDKCNEFYETWE